MSILITKYKKNQQVFSQFPYFKLWLWLW